VLTKADKVKDAQALVARLAEEFPGTSGAARAAALPAEPTAGVASGSEERKSGEGTP